MILVLTGEKVANSTFTTKELNKGTTTASASTKSTRKLTESASRSMRVPFIPTF